MLLLTVTVLSAAAPVRTSPHRAAHQSSPQTGARDRALQDGIARARRTNLRHAQLGDFTVPESNRAYA